ncbi:HTH-type transcriptional regulator BhcR [Roseibium sediminicola]|uniref:IclR family transcriptional regulator n=1 Tax=Roseibium sediminicola TaxID=2933272 RepID=A0ABT0GWQ5_9HYPH|nr:HTH-type transcriptional regulator BhcR [Roseibium sp. CAU 1639]MCK7613874.1 IclR family transcriptional regulator [Roseibium sp. CAU 1639]
MADPKSDPSTSRRARGRPRAWDDKSEQNTIKSLDRAMAVFEHLSTQSGVSLSALSEQMGESTATLYRILFTLEARGLVEFDQAQQLWHIGPGAFIIGARFLRRTSLVERARPILRALMEQTGETANLGVAQGDQVLFVSQVETHESIRAFFPPGTLSPLHASGIGKALLAFMDPDQCIRILAKADRQRFTEHTLCEVVPLKENLDLIRARGFSIDGEEKNLGMRCIAAPVFNHYGEAVAGLSVSGPTSRVSPDKVEALAGAVKAAAASLTAALGGETGPQQVPHPT